METNQSNKSRQIAFLFIGIGIVIFIANTGILQLGSILSLRFLPFLVIAVGAFLLLGKRSGTIAAIAVLGLGAITSYFQLQIPGISIIKGESHQIQRSLEGARSAKIKISSSVASLNISELDDKTLLAEGNIETNDNENLITEFSVKNGQAKYSLKAKKQNQLNVFSQSSGRSWDLKLNPNIPLDLDISTGVGDASLDLSKFNLTDLDIATGVGDAEITLPKKGDFKASISTGVGGAVIKIPSSLAIRIKLSKGVGSLDIDGAFEKRDRYYYSSNYNSDSKYVELDIDTGVGDITIKSF